jgi:hypothetical protein
MFSITIIDKDNNNNSYIYIVDTNTTLGNIKGLYCLTNGSSVEDIKAWKSYDKTPMLNNANTIAQYNINNNDNINIAINWPEEIVSYYCEF